VSVLLAYGTRHGRVWSNEDASALAVSLQPESGPMSMPRMLRVGLRSPEEWPGQLANADGPTWTPVS
jgi:hypothetical protein